MYGIVVNDEITMDDSTFGGDVDLNSAKVDGSISATESTFTKELILSDATVGGDLLLNGSKFGGNVSLNFSKVTRDTVVSGATLTVGLTAIGAGFGTLTLGREDSPSRWGDAALLDLTAAHAIMIHDYFSPNEKNELKSWPSRLSLAGFSYEKLGSLTSENASDMLERSTDWFDEWLMRGQSVSAQPYRQLSDVLRESGFPEKADAVLYAARNHELAENWREGRCCYGLGLVLRKGECWDAVGLGLLKFSIGYGLGSRFFRILWWVVGFTAVGGGFLWFSPAARAKGLFWRLGASLDHLLPIVELNKEFTDFFNDPGRQKLKGWQLAYFGAHAIIGYVLAFFVVAGLAGLTQVP